MKRFWLILLLLGLIAAFSTSAMAVDVKFSGEYSVTGMYLDRTSLQEDINPSTAFFYQRLRLRTEFVVAPGLSLITRADIMERSWGASRTAAGNTLDVPFSLPGANIGMSGGTRAENENIAFDWLYISYTSPIGHFLVGYVDYGVWGTVFGDTSWIAPRIMYTAVKGGLTFRTAYVKGGEWDYGTYPTSPYMGADRDYDIYYPIVATYAFKQGRVGLLTQYQVARSTRVAGVKTEAVGLAPYAMLKFGPVSFQTEITYAFGKYLDYEFSPSPDDVKIENWSGWIDATADLGMFYVGGSLAYVSGDKKDTAKQEGGLLNGGYNWNPCLIMWNYDRTYWVGSLSGHNTSSNASSFANGFFGQLRGGIRPVDQLDIMGSVSWAKAERHPVTSNWESRDYGWEVDLTGTYKITNNLSYMLGAGYWFVGDYYKGASAANKVDDNFMVINKLTLTF